MPAIVIDTCVLVDIFISTRPRHAVAVELQKLIRQKSIAVRLPAFALFELHHAIRQERRQNGGILVQEENSGWQSTLPVELVSIDEAFIEQHLTLDLPEVRAGDLVFLALAKGESLSLVTEDVTFKIQAVKAGVSVFTIQEYLRSQNAA